MGKEISIKKAALINAAASYSCVVLQLLANSWLAWLPGLSTKDFGIIAAVSVFTTFFTVVSNMGIGPAIIQNKTITDDEVSDIFTFNFYVAVIVALLFFVLAEPIAGFLGNDVYVPICRLLSVSLFFHTMNIIPHSLLLKQKRFVLIGMRMVAVTIASYGAAIAMVYLGFSYYGLVWQAILFAAVSFIWNFASTRIKLKITFRLSSIKKIFSFSVFQLGYSIINYMSKNLDNIVISKCIGDVGLGVYDKAYKLTLYPQNNLTNVITPTLHPILSEHQNDKPYIYEKYMNIVKILSLLGMFIGLYFCFASKEIIHVMFSDKFAASVPCLAWLSLSIWSQVITASAQAIFQSAGNTKTMFISSLFTVAMTGAAVTLGAVQGSIEQISIYLMIAFNLNFFVTYYMLISRTLHMSYAKFLKTFIPDVCIAAMVAASGIAVSFIPIGEMMVGAGLTYSPNSVIGMLAGAAVKGVVMGTVFLAGLLIFKQHKILISFLKKKKD